MVINAQTKISSLLRQRADVLEAIISLSPRFEKLRNPLLRKVMAPRTTIAAATRIAGCSLSDFFEKLAPLGFEANINTVEEATEEKQMPSFMQGLQQKVIVVLDVRPILSGGEDPLRLIMEKTRQLKQGQVLKIINTFYPEPLVLLLQKQGFESFADRISDERVETYFHKTGKVGTTSNETEKATGRDWEDIMGRYKNKMTEIDVRHLPMPQPMMTILRALDNLPPGQALFVYHKRIPVYLLPELTARKFGYRAKEISEGNVHMIIFKN